MAKPPSPIEILLVEDNPADANLVRRKMSGANTPNSVHVVHTGVDALAFVGKEGEFQEAPRPDMVLLDLNIPGLDGREVLEHMKSEPSLRTIPVVVLTSSEAPDDIAHAYELGANAYVRKPIDLDGYRQLVAAIDAFWFTVVRFRPQR